MARFTDLPYDVLELMMFRLRLLPAADIAAVRMASPGLAALLGSKFDLARHRAIGGLRACLDWSFPDAALQAIKRGADPATLNWRALRLAIRTGHRRLFAYVMARAIARFEAAPDSRKRGSVRRGIRETLDRTLAFAARADAAWAVLEICRVKATGPSGLYGHFAPMGSFLSRMSPGVLAAVSAYYLGQARRGKNFALDQLISNVGYAAARGEDELDELEGLARTRHRALGTWAPLNRGDCERLMDHLLAADDNDAHAEALARFVQMTTKAATFSSHLYVVGLVLCVAGKPQLARAVFGAPRRYREATKDLPLFVARGITRDEHGWTRSTLVQALERLDGAARATYVAAIAGEMRQLTDSAGGILLLKRIQAAFLCRRLTFARSHPEVLDGLFPEHAADFRRRWARLEAAGGPPPGDSRQEDLVCFVKNSRPWTEQVLKLRSPDLRATILRRQFDCYVITAVTNDHIAPWVEGVPLGVALGAAGLADPELLAGFGGGVDPEAVALGAAAFDGARTALRTGRSVEETQDSLARLWETSPLWADAEFQNIAQSYTLGSFVMFSRHAEMQSAQEELDLFLSWAPQHVHNAFGHLRYVFHHNPVTPRDLELIMKIKELLERDGHSLAQHRTWGFRGSCAPLIRAVTAGRTPVVPRHVFSIDIYPSYGSIAKMVKDCSPRELEYLISGTYPVR